MEGPRCYVHWGSISFLLGDDVWAWLCFVWAWLYVAEILCLILCVYFIRLFCIVVKISVVYVFGAAVCC